MRGLIGSRIWSEWLTYMKLENITDIEGW